MSGDRSVAELVARWPSARPFAVAGGVCIVAGGLVAALTRPTGFESGSWVAAYLVLVGGVAQLALGAGQAWLSARPPRTRRVWFEVIAWNAGGAATVLGSLLPAPIVTTVGGLLTMAAIGVFLVGVRVAAPARGVAPVVYRGLAAIVVVSIPIGLGMAWIRHG